MAKVFLQTELRHLRYFIAAAEYGSFRKAGAALDIESSAVSRRVRDLEDHLGASLFQRHSGGVRPTLAGQRFLRHARIALQQLDAGAKDVAAIGSAHEGAMKVGIFSSLASGFLFELLRAYDKEHPSVLVELIDGNPTEHIAAVRQHQLDVAFITGTATREDCEVEHLWSERVFAVLPSNHRLAAKNEVRWCDLSGESFIVSDGAPGPEIHDYLVQRLADLGHHPDINVQNVGRDVLLSMVAVGRGLTLTSEATTGARIPGIAYRPIVHEVLPFSAIWSPNNDNPACRRLLSLARTMSRLGQETEGISHTLRLRSPAAPSQSPDRSQ